VKTATERPLIFNQSTILVAAARHPLTQSAQLAALSATTRVVKFPEI